jgi:hypothetical protein
VEILVADPSFRGTSTEKVLENLAESYKVELLWHCGYGLAVEEVPDNFRGPTMPSLAARISHDDYIDARIIGEAAASLKKNPQEWADRGSYEFVLQELKCLWHVCVHFGNKSSSFTPTVGV